MKQIFAFFFLLACFFNVLQAEVINPNNKPLTFHYNKELIEQFKHCPYPSKNITNEELTTLYNETNYLIKTTDLSPLDRTILPAYLASAQKDFAWISYRLTGKFAGDLGPITLWTLRLFIPNAFLPSVHADEFDPFSSAIAALVLSEVIIRLNNEKKQIANYPIKNEPGLWTPTSVGYWGLDYGTAKPWFLTSSKEFVVEKPSRDNGYWLSQTQEVLISMQKRDGTETESVFWWANLPAPDAGEWSAILQKYFVQNNTPLATRLWAKALLECAALDSCIAAFNSKYTFWIKRPSQTNSQIHPLIAVPNHPSYPSAHSTVSSTIAVVLTELFPESKEVWANLLEEAGMSRIYGGIHYPVDHTKGIELGEIIGQTVLKRSK